MITTTSTGFNPDGFLAFSTVLISRTPYEPQVDTNNGLNIMGVYTDRFANAGDLLRKALGTIYDYTGKTLEDLAGVADEPVFSEVDDQGHITLICIQVAEEDYWLFSPIDSAKVYVNIPVM